MKKTLAALGLTALMTTATSAQELNAADECVIDFFNDVTTTFNELSKNIGDIDDAIKVGIELTYSRATLDELTTDCEDQTNIKAASIRELDRIDSGLVTIIIEP